MIAPRPLPAGLVLAGGRASRLGGGDKPLRRLGGETILARILGRLQPQCGPLALSANGDPARFAAFGLPVLADEGPAGQAGPLAGILSGLEWARRDTDAASLVTVAGDTPFFPGDLVETLSAAVAGHPDRIAVAASGGRWHPVFALWPVSIADDLRDFLSRSPTFSVAAFLQRHEAVTVTFAMIPSDASPVDPFFNINTRDDLAAAETIAGQFR